MTGPRFPSAEGLANAIEELAEAPAGRLNSTIPVLLAVEAGLEAGQAIELSGYEAVPNPNIFARLDEWFGISGEGKEYFVPFTLPGGRSLHRRDEKILSQGTMTAAKGRGWVAAAEQVAEGERDRAYPLVDLEAWREAVVEGVESAGGHGIDLAPLGIWLGRQVGVPAEEATPTRDELVAFALAKLGLPDDATHDLCQTTPPILTADGGEDWLEVEGDDFQEEPLTLPEITAICDEFDPVSAPDATSGAVTAVPIDVAELELDDHVRRMLHVSVASSKAIMLIGPPGTGKTELVWELEEMLHGGAAGALGITTPPQGISTATPDDEWSASTLIGGLTLDEKESLSFRPGYLLQAIAEDRWLLLDEANRGDLDKIFGGVLTWLTGKRVRVGMTSTAHNAQPIFLEWSDDETCHVIGFEQLEPGAEATEPVRFVAGKNWRLLGTYNPVDAQRVFRLGQALGRRFRRVPVPPPTVAQLRSILELRAADLSTSLRNAIVAIYIAHQDIEPPLGAAPYLDICEYLLTAQAAVGAAGPAGGEDESGAEQQQDEEPELVQDEPEEEAAMGGEGDAGDQPAGTLGPADSRLLAESYLTSLASWLSQLTPPELVSLRSSLVPKVFSNSDWSWLERMLRSL